MWNMQCVLLATHNNKNERTEKKNAFMIVVV